MTDDAPVSQRRTLLHSCQGFVSVASTGAALGFGLMIGASAAIANWIVLVRLFKWLGV